MGIMRQLLDIPIFLTKYLNIFNPSKDHIKFNHEYIMVRFIWSSLIHKL